MALGFRIANNIKIYGVFRSDNAKKKRENTAYLTILRGPQKCQNKMCCQNNKNKNKHKSRLEQFRNCESA